jgi:type II secretory pathway component PulJ
MDALPHTAARSRFQISPPATNLLLSNAFMKTLPHPPIIPKRRPTAAFTLTETVIAIGVLAVLLTGFIAVFTPAAQGIRRSISSEQADRLTSTLEAELVTPRLNQSPAGNQSNPNTAITGFTKAFDWIQKGNTAATAIFVYQYRGNPSVTRRTDGTMIPRASLASAEPGKNNILQTMARRANDPLLEADLDAVEGSVFFVRPIQLVFNNGQLEPSTSPTTILNADGTTATTAAAYQDAVIAFTAEFHSVPSKTIEYLTGNGFKTRHGRIIAANSTIKPVFTRNLAVRR